MVNIDIQAIRNLAENIPTVVGPDFTAASATLTSARGIEHSNFTSVTPGLAVAYVAAVEFVEEQLKSKNEHLGDIRAKLNFIASAWADVEIKNTPKK
jgi:hypothetical protein